MGNLEKESKKRARKENIQKVILETLKLAGILSVGMLAPNVMGSFAKLGIVDKNTNHRFNRSFNSLIKGGFIKIDRKEGRKLIRITSAGKDKLTRIYAEETLKRPRRWDGKWRIVIYDLSEKRKSLRERTRLTFLSLGFRRLQDSVWVYPHDCEDLINLMKADFKIGKDLLYIIADSIEYDKPLREFFGLK